MQWAEWALWLYFNMLSVTLIHLRCDNTNEIGLKCIENSKIYYCINGAWHQMTHSVKCNVQNRMKWPLSKKKKKGVRQDYLKGFSIHSSIKRNLAL